MREKPKLLSVEVREEDVLAVFREFEAANPGKPARYIDREEFTSKMMKKIMATVKVIEGGNA